MADVRLPQQFIMALITLSHLLTLSHLRRQAQYLPSRWN
jgi:hypothetical protein